MCIVCGAVCVVRVYCVVNECMSINNWLCSCVVVRADVTMDVCSLSTGYSTEVHGILRINGRHPRSDSSGANVCEVWSQSLLFKALDTGVKCSIVNK
jgi:hypothetical protein